MTDYEFLTVTTYRDAVVPAWVLSNASANPASIQRAFKEGADAVLNNIERRSECAKSSTPIAPRVLESGSEEPPRDTFWRDPDGDLWRYGVAGNGHVGWYFDHSAYSWNEVRDTGPLVEVV